MPPIYDFLCKACSTQFETMSSFSDFERWQKQKDNIPCPKCASHDVEKQISTGTSFQYKGKGNSHMSGWYGKDKKK